MIITATRHQENILLAQENMRLARMFFALFVAKGWQLTSSPVSITRMQLDEAALAAGLAQPDDSPVERRSARNKYMHHINAGGQNYSIPADERFKVVCINRRIGLFNILSIADAHARAIDTYTGNMVKRGEGIIEHAKHLASHDVMVGLPPAEVGRRQMSFALLEAVQQTQVSNATIYGNFQTTLLNINKSIELAQQLAHAQIAPPVVNSDDERHAA